MATERRRLLELALESLENRKKEIDAEIAALRRQMGGRSAAPRAAAPAGPRRRKRSRFSKEERLRRSRRMKAYWEKWRKQKGGQK